MKTLHIATTDIGGAALGMLNLHFALLKAGVDSKVLVASKATACDTIFQMQPNFDQFHFSKNKIIRKIQKILRKKGYRLSERERWNNKVSQISSVNRSSCFTSPYSQYNILESKLVQEADIIHLHWVGDFLDYMSFFEGINKPVVWTIRDENPGLGGFHYRKEKEKLYGYYQEIEDHYLSVKKNSISKFKYLTLVNLSEVMMDFCRGVDYFSHCPTYKIYNSIDSKKYSLIDRSIARRVLDINDDQYVVSFVSVVLSDYRKNIEKVLSAVNQLQTNSTLLCVGINDCFDGRNSNVICYGKIDNPQLMSLIYSASDVFVTPSFQESFGKTTIEALLCGTPVVASATGVAPEILNETNGVLIDKISDESILYALKKIQNNNYNREKIRQDIVDVFSPQKIAQDYIHVYEDILKRYPK